PCRLAHRGFCPRLVRWLPVRSNSFLATGRAALVFFLGTVAGCSSLLPKSKETTGAAGSGWQSYQDAQQAFDRIVPGKTTVAELAWMKLDPRANPNITILPRYEVMSRFIVNQTVTDNDLDEGVRLCIEARQNCRALQGN